MSFKNTTLASALLVGALWTVQTVKAQTPAFEMVNFQEMADPTKDTLSDWSAVKKGVHSSFVTIDKRYPKSLVPDLKKKVSDEVVGWRGERVSSQVLLWTQETAPDVTVTISDFKGIKGAKMSSNVASARFVRYVMTDEFAAGCGYRKKEDFASSLSPDMLDDLTSFDLEASKVRPVWLTVKIPSDATPGEYQAKVRIESKGKVTDQLTLKVTVLENILPKPSEWVFHLDQWQHPSAVARVRGLEMWSDAHFEAMKPVMKMLADAGQKVITATMNKDPWNVQTYDPYADMIVWNKNADGTWAYDYKVFDRWVQFMMDLGIKKMINIYSIVPWNNEIHYRDVAKNEVVNVVAKPGTPAFEELWTPFLKDLVKHLDSKGWLGITNIAMDERTKEEVDGALSLLKKVAPTLGVSYADNQKTYQRYPDSKDISIAANHPFSHEDLLDRKKRGLITTFYVYCGNNFPNQFTFSDPAESAYMGWYAEAADFDGLLHWAFNSWVENPILDSRFRTWPAGDTYIVYPNGRSSIRYERTLEGVQDYEKVQIVKKALKEKGLTEDLKRFEAAIQKLNSAERTKVWNSNLNEAKALLNELSIKITN
ncbi:MULTISPECIES: DUF4091 domain-containing protein [Sphingobacterium]|uniref:DUF4091 domain-containing protein n=1 Tax=Sphingobacterium TaxID=28453 RepID=UPI00104AEE6A|nr:MULTISPECIES: DUF4091 domain-containing protein [Sphingobacterium]MCW2263797.1 hypothetical protein [Sphingobacterium kitahiroshimense]TCR00675.1 uncharacterized protein DUF4091 [Sphingobacterium sp. JUb78]